jgi:hypothetical protein
MPQLEVLSFMSQLFWFNVFFWAFYAATFFYFVVPFAYISKLEEYMVSLSYKHVVGEIKPLDVVSTASVDVVATDSLNRASTFNSRNTNNTVNLDKNSTSIFVVDSFSFLKENLTFTSERTLLSISKLKSIVNS